MLDCEIEETKNYYTHKDSARSESTNTITTNNSDNDKL